jgi:hypothetical protein
LCLIFFSDYVNLSLLFFQDVSVPEAFPLSDFDEAAVKSGHAEASRAFSSAPDGSVARASAQIEVDTLAAIARALGVTL